MAATNLSVEKTLNVVQKKTYEEEREDILKQIRQEAQKESSEGSFFKLLNENIDKYKLSPMYERDPITGQTFFQIAVQHDNTPVINRMSGLFFVKINEVIKKAREAGLKRVHLDRSLLTLQDYQGHTPRELALKLGNTELYKFLLGCENRVFDQNVYTQKQWSIMDKMSLESFKVEMVSKFIDPNYQAPGIKNLLLALDYGDDFEVTGIYAQKLRYLIVECGGDPNLKDNVEYGSTLLHLFLVNDLRKIALDFFSYATAPEMKFNPNLKDINGRTTLMIAIAMGFNEMVEAILKKRVELGLQLNAQDKNGFTALHYASLVRNAKAVCLLIDAGANTEIPDNKGRKPIELLDVKHTAELKILMDGLSFNICRDKNAKSDFLENKNGLPLIKFSCYSEYLNRIKKTKKTITLVEQYAFIKDILNEGKKAHSCILATREAFNKYSSKQIITVLNTSSKSKLVCLNEPRAKIDLEFVTKTIEKFAGISLESHLLSSSKTTLTQRIFELDTVILAETAAESRVVPAVREQLMLFTFNRKKPKK